MEYESGSVESESQFQGQEVNEEMIWFINEAYSNLFSKFA